MAKELLRSVLRRGWIGVLGCLLCLPGHSDDSFPRDFVWRIQGRSGTLYLAGSLHELRAGDRPSQSLYYAYAQADRLVFEADISEFDQPAFRQEIEKLALLPPGQALSSKLEATVVRQLQQLAKRSDLPSDTFDRYRPWYVASSVGSLMLTELGYDETHGIDRYFFDRARRERKGLLFLETGQQQLALIAQIPEREAIESISQDLKDGEASARELVRCWSEGDALGMERLNQEDARSQPVSYRRLLVDRNRAWIPQLESWLNETNRTLVIVGAGHLVGTNGLVQLLSSRGYSTVQLPEAVRGKR